MRSVWIRLAICLALCGPPIAAEMCTLDPVPAATLLLPYFEVDLAASQGNGVNTVFTIHNAFPRPALAHVVLWSDWSQPVLNFDVFLTGYDAQTVDLYDVLVNGNLPVTADEQSDQGQFGDSDPTSSCDGTVDSCSPHGSNPEWDGSFVQTAANASVDCGVLFPLYINPLLQGMRLADVQAKLSGQPIDGSCFGEDHGDSIARGYVTVDNVDTCSLIVPSDADYFSDGVNPAVANNNNQLWGDWQFIDPANQLTRPRDPLVHIEASETFVGSYSFYSRYTQAMGTRDNREPLPNSWGFRYQDLGLGQVTDLVVWRDSTANNQPTGGFSCDTGPDWKPLGQSAVVCFDQSENLMELCDGSDCFPLESQQVELGSGELQVPWSTGWCFVGTDFTDTGVTGDVDFPGNVVQSWIGATVRDAGITAGGYHSIAFSHPCEASLSFAVLEPLFSDGFESGDTSAWSARQE